ncbi:hypothetical protein LG202_08810 [Methylobacillus methanolivorans]
MELSLSQDIVFETDYPTYEDLGCPDYQLTIKEYATGIIDMVMRKVNFMEELRKARSDGLRGVPYKPELTEEEQAAKDAENRLRAARRAKKKVRELIQSIGADHLLTLTYRENVEDTDVLNADFTRFIRLVRRKYPNWLYVAVKEYQERGALHMHVACVGFQDLPYLRACWYEAIGGNATDTGANTKGQVDLRFQKKRWSGNTPVYTAFQLAAYLSKYIAKTFEHDDQLGQRRYKASRGIPAPKITRQYLGAFAAIHKEGTFLKAMQQVVGIADLMGIRVDDYQLWNRETDVLILRGFI